MNLSNFCPKTWLIGSMVFIGGAFVLSCAPDLPQDDVETRTQVVFDQESGIVPLPTDVALEEDGTLPFQGQNPEGETAQADFYRYLDGIKGWLPATGIEFPISGKLDEETIEPNQNVHLFRKTDESFERVTIESVNYTEVENEESPVQARIQVQPSESIARDTQYAAALTEGIQDSEGNPLVAPQPFYLTANDEPLVDENGNPQLSVLEGQADTAKQLEALRQTLNPVYNYMSESHNVARTDVIAITKWTTTSETFAAFRPGTGEIPFPNAALMSADGSSVNIPIPGDAGPYERQLLELANQQSAFGMSSKLWVPFDGGVDTETLNYQNVKLAETSGSLPSFYEEGDFGIRFVDGHLLMEPNTVLKSGTQQVGILTSSIKNENGRSVKPTSQFVFLRSEYPLVEQEGECAISSGACDIPDSAECTSTVDQLSASQAIQLEEGRCSYSQLFQSAPLLIDGVENREDVVLGWAYDTQNPHRMVREMKARVTAKYSESGSNISVSCDGGAGNCVTQNPGSEYSHPAFDSSIDLSNIGEMILKGSFSNYPLFDEEGERKSYDSLAASSEENVGFSLLVPSSDNCEQNETPKVVLSQHGLGSSRLRAALSMANQLAEQCLATLAIDLPHHGGRAPQTSSLHPEQIPENSGDGFIGTDLKQAKNNFVQSIADMVLTTRLVKNGRFTGLFASGNGDPSPRLDASSPLKFVGVSLGGLLGIPFVTVEPDVNRMALNGVGGRLGDLVVHAIESGNTSGLGSSFASALSEAGIEEGTFEFEQTFGLMQWLIESVDPLVFANHTVEETFGDLTYDPSNDSYSVRTENGSEVKINNTVYLQMIEGDSIVPNSATERLVDELGPSVSLSESTYSDVPHEFLLHYFGDSELESTAKCAQRQIAGWLTTKDVDVPSAEDCMNGGSNN